MPLDLQTALNSYGFVGQLANAIPDLRSILDQAMRENWVPERVDRAIQDSNWWKTNGEAARNLARQQALDPATYQVNLNNTSQKVALMSEQMGRPLAPDKAQYLAWVKLLYNWDDDQVRSWIGQNGTAQVVEGGLTGDVGQINAHLRQLAANYGVAYTDGWINTAIQTVQSGFETLDGYESIIKARAKAQYAHLAGQIDAGMTVRDIADPYIATYAQTLEVPESAVGLDDPAIQKALQAKNAEGGFGVKPMYEFVRQLKDDPRWDKTKNAETEAYRMVNRLGKDMGFLS